MPGFNIDSEGSSSLPFGTGSSAKVETARKSRWRIIVADPIKDIIVHAYKATRPVLDLDTVTIHRGQDELYFPGKNRWLPVNFTFYEVVDKRKGNYTAGSLYAWQSTVVLDLAKSSIKADFKRHVQYDQHDGCGNSLYEYALAGAWPTKITPSDLDYSDSSIAEITVTLKYDKAQERNGVR